MKDIEKIELNEQNIRQALSDYFKHTNDKEILNDVSGTFISNLARDNYYAKQELRELFRKSPVWNEQLDAIVINGSRTHEPDYFRIHELMRQILKSRSYTNEQLEKIHYIIPFFINADLSGSGKECAIKAMKELAPKAYSSTKKKTRVLKAVFDALGLNNDTCADFNYLYAQIADEMTSHKIDFKLFVSLNPAHFITMSNPKGDERGSLLTSCHSFNSTEYEYNNCCSGYARDHYTFIAFTVVDPTNAETLNNRKNMRQIFCYKPNNGVLLQSRLYNNAGGVNREAAESKIFRDLIQREISDLEGAANLWHTFKYYDNDKIELTAGVGFGGYHDWEYSEFNAKVSIRADHEGDYRPFEIGTYGLCIVCGDEISDGLYCHECRNANKSLCACCNERFDDDELYQVHDGDDVIYVCESCRDNYYFSCSCCEEDYDSDSLTQVSECEFVCPDCLERYFTQCDNCGEWVRNEDALEAENSRGNDVLICRNCAESYYIECEFCGHLVHEHGLLSIK